MSRSERCLDVIEQLSYGYHRSAEILGDATESEDSRREALKHLRHGLYVQGLYVQAEFPTDVDEVVGLANEVGDALLELAQSGEVKP